MSSISFERQPSPAKLEILGVFDWPIWEKEVSEFPWSYDRSETCYFMRGDLVTFPAGMSCTWKILKPVEQHYSFG